MTPILELVGVSKAYGALRPLRIDRLTVHSGEAVAILGLDGPAAEVLVNLVMGAVLPDEGQVTAFGRETASISDAAEWVALADRFGIVSDRLVLLDALTVIQNLSMPFTLNIEPPPADVRERARALARLVGLPDSSWDAPVASLGDAARVRVHLARALAPKPELLLLEHAAAGLEHSASRAELARLVSAVASRGGTAILALTADPAFASGMAARVLRHDAGTGRLAGAAGWRVWPKRLR